MCHVASCYISMDSLLTVSIVYFKHNISLKVFKPLILFCKRTIAHETTVVVDIFDIDMVGCVINNKMKSRHI